MAKLELDDNAAAERRRLIDRIRWCGVVGVGGQRHGVVTPTLNGCGSGGGSGGINARQRGKSAGPTRCSLLGQHGRHHRRTEYGSHGAKAAHMAG
eukprot:6485378-Amphidinium_carterae.1